MPQVPYEQAAVIVMASAAIGSILGPIIVWSAYCLYLKVTGR